MSSAAPDLCVFVFAKYSFTYFLSKFICMSFLFSKFHLCILIKMFKEFSISCFNIFISVFALFKTLVNLCSFKLLGLFFMTQGELPDFKAIAKC